MSKGGNMAAFRSQIGKLLLGLAAVAWTACSSDNGTGADGSMHADSSSGQGDSSSSAEQMSSSSLKTSLTREDFFNADSLIAVAKQPKVTTDSCVTARNYCETLTGENSSGSRAAGFLFEERIGEILDNPKAENLTERCKSYLQKQKSLFFSMAVPTTVYGISPCYNVDINVLGDSTLFKYIVQEDPDPFWNTFNPETCGDGELNHVKVDSTYLYIEKANAERYAKDFEKVVNYVLEDIEAECK